MNSYFTNLFLFISVFIILIGIFYYTKITKETFFASSSDLPNTIVILDGKTEKGNYNIYTDQLPDTCSETCSNYLVDPSRICSANVQNDGNLVVYNSRGKAVWASDTSGEGAPPYRTVMQGDGNYVLYDANNTPLWSSGTSGEGVYPFRVIMQGDCNLVLYDGNWQSTWSSGTQGKGSGPAPFNRKIPISWNQIPGELYSVCLLPNSDIIGTNLAGEIWYKRKEYINFFQIPGKLNMITTDGSHICGINNNNDIACATYGNGMKGDFTIIHRNAKSISVSNNKVYGVSTANALMYSTDISDLNNVFWKYIPITLVRFHQVSLDGTTILGINEKNELVYADRNIFSPSPNFTKMKVKPEMANFINVTLKNNRVLVTDTEGNLWYCSNYKNPDWVKINSKKFTFMASMN